MKSYKGEIMDFQIIICQFFKERRKLLIVSAKDGVSLVLLSPIIQVVSTIWKPEAIRFDKHARPTFCFFEHTASK